MWRAALTAVGFACYGIDFRGHGLSEGLRVYIHDGQLAVDELESLYQIVRAQHPDLPALLFGHSMGSLIGLGFVLRHPDRLRGIALGGVALHGERAKPAWAGIAVSLGGKICPEAAPVPARLAHHPDRRCSGAASVVG